MTSIDFRKDDTKRREFLALISDPLFQEAVQIVRNEHPVRDGVGSVINFTSEQMHVALGSLMSDEDALNRLLLLSSEVVVTTIEPPDFSGDPMGIGEEEKK